MTTFEVPITSEWLDAKNWDPLPINEPTEATGTLDEPGTTIHVRELYEGVARHFANAAFENEVRTAIAEHFTMFLQSGLKVEFNGAPGGDRSASRYSSRQTRKRPAPYVYQKTIDDVIVSITVGLNTGKSLGDDEEDDAGFERDRSSATAGWTVLCNDRAVIVGDKSRLTGWGDGIPLYHPQFAIITGIIEFRSKRADKLPVTTTKRALDTSSNVWLESLVKMKEGMRIWISYTNQWKNHPRADQSSHWETAKPMPLSKAIEAVATRKLTKRVGDTIEFNPQKAKVLPEPEDKKPSSRKIVFSRPAEEVRLVSKLLFDDPDEKPGIVGDKCFEMQLTKAKKQGGLNDECRFVTAVPVAAQQSRGSRTVPVAVDAIGSEARTRKVPLRRPWWPIPRRFPADPCATRHRKDDVHRDRRGGPQAAAFQSSNRVDRMCPQDT